VIPTATFARDVWRLLQKDLRREFRTRLTWPAAFLMGLLLVLTLEFQTDLPEATKQQITGGFLWLVVFITGTIGFEKSFTDENDDGCLDALRMCPVSPAAIYTSKVTLNFLMLVCITTVLILLFTLFAEAPLLDRPTETLSVVLLANLGLAAIGTLIGAIVNRIRTRGNLIALLLLPLVLPVLLGAGEATRLSMANDIGEEFGRWLQLLAAFAAVVVTTSLLVFDFVLED
jgi:heme exporter protein B